MCVQLGEDPLLEGGYTGLGISQGGLLMRGLVQRCPAPPARRLVTLGSPHQGVFGVPECEETTGSRELCELVRQLLSLGAYVPWIQVSQHMFCTAPVNERFKINVVFEIPVMK